MNERIQYQGHLREEELREHDLRLRIAGLRDSIKIKLDPFIGVEHLAADLVAKQALDLAQMHIQYLECVKTIGAIKRALGQA